MNNEKPVHAPLSQFEVVGGEVLIGGLQLGRLARRVGSTPFYAYDRAKLIERVHHVRSLLPQTVRLHYSIKANPMPALVQQMAVLVDGLDVASAGELRTALDTGIDPATISFAGPGKTDAELSQAIAAGVMINVESSKEIDRAARIGDALGIAPQIVMRVNPDFELKNSGMRMSGGAKPFGIDAEMVPMCARQIDSLGITLQGLHIFSGSQSLKAMAIAESHTQAFELARRLADATRQVIPGLYLGAGFGIPYFAGEQRLDLSPICENLQKLTDSLDQQLPATRVSLESGRYLVGEAGLYVARVIDRKESRGVIFLVTDGGLHHHLAASGNFGQVIRKNYPVAVGSRMADKEHETVTIVGPLCTPLDILADKVELPRADVGDLIVIFQSGAYGFSASPVAFLGHPPPLEVLV
ncbi:pyridoxal-dependent decarboxylase, exosortase A system-associated [Massilia sp. DWR3-1-1]|uniref:pyridoxal-dependent decarboxylase, exosortase A system-associated n=1 Tax=Massilia sp. DWR3-1-1 TaxID=2804559 RepID=UPI003CFA976F